MNRNTFLKSLLVGLVAPKVVVDATEPKSIIDVPRRSRDMEAEYYTDYGKGVRLQSTHGYFYRCGDTIKWQEITEEQAAQFKMWELITKVKPKGYSIDMAAIHNIQL